MSFPNTRHSGSVRNVIFEENGAWFGVALEFNIVESGDSPQEVMVLLDNAIRGYVEAADKGKLSIGVLNQEVDPEYEALWTKDDVTYEHAGKRVYSTSSQPLAALSA